MNENRKPGYLKWIFLGCGCLVIFGILAGLFFGGTIAGIIGGVFTIIKKSEPYKMSVDLVEKNSSVRNEIGSIQSYGFFPTGNINYTDGIADMKIQVTGEKGEGSLETELFRKGDKWKFKKAVFYPSSGKEIDLLK